MSFLAEFLMNKSLTTSEQAQFDQLEATVRDGLQTFIQVGKALLEIRDKRLYRVEFGTFEQYCRERWGWSRQHANRQIEAAKVAQELEPFGFKIETESQARAIKDLPTEQKTEVLQQAQAEGDTSARNLEQLAAEAFAAMTVENQRRVIEDSERQAMEQSQPNPTPVTEEGRKEQIQRLANRMKRIHAGLTDVADELDQIIEQYMKIVHSSNA